jgi:hypothetical protein
MADQPTGKGSEASSVRDGDEDVQVSSSDESSSGYESEEVSLPRPATKSLTQEDDADWQPEKNLKTRSSRTE